MLEQEVGSKTFEPILQAAWLHTMFQRTIISANSAFVLWWSKWLSKKFTFASNASPMHMSRGSLLFHLVAKNSSSVLLATNVKLEKEWVYLLPNASSIFSILECASDIVVLWHVVCVPHVPQICCHALCAQCIPLGNLHLLLIRVNALCMLWLRFATKCATTKKWGKRTLHQRHVATNNCPTDFTTNLTWVFNK